jgi:nitroreductase
MSANPGMNLFEAIRQRQSIRTFQGRDIEPEKLEAVLSAVNQAPSAGNLQAYQVWLVRDRALRDALVHAAWEQEFIAQAPVVLAFCAAPARAGKYGARGETLYAVQDASVAAAYAQLAAVALGLGTCWVGAFDEQAVSQALRLPADQRPGALLPLGYPAENTRRTSRRPLDELVREVPPLPAPAS